MTKQHAIICLHDSQYFFYYLNGLKMKKALYSIEQVHDIYIPFSLLAFVLKICYQYNKILPAGGED